jgi:hypothetical protein
VQRHAHQLLADLETAAEQGSGDLALAAADQRSGVSGSPRIASAFSASSAAGRSGCSTTARLRPPPGRRTREPIGLTPPCNSTIARRIVLRANPVAADAALTPP